MANLTQRQKNLLINPYSLQKSFVFVDIQDDGTVKKDTILVESYFQFNKESEQPLRFVFNLFRKSKLIAVNKTDQVTATIDLDKNLNIVENIPNLAVPCKGKLEGTNHELKKVKDLIYLFIDSLEEIKSLEMNGIVFDYRVFLLNSILQNQTLSLSDSLEIQSKSFTDNDKVKILENTLESVKIKLPSFSDSLDKTVLGILTTNQKKQLKATESKTTNKTEKDNS